MEPVGRNTVTVEHYGQWYTGTNMFTDTVFSSLIGNYFLSGILGAQNVGTVKEGISNTFLTLKQIYKICHIFFAIFFLLEGQTKNSTRGCKTIKHDFAIPGRTFF